MDHNTGNYAQPWAAMLGHHAMNSDPGFAHHGLPMDLHISQGLQGFSYYRWTFHSILSANSIIESMLAACNIKSESKEAEKVMKNYIQLSRCSREDSVHKKSSFLIDFLLAGIFVKNISFLVLLSMINILEMIFFVSSFFK